MEIDVKTNILDENERLADKINRALTAKNCFAINVMGAPGVGKTTTLLNIIPMLGDSAFVIEGDIQSDIDTQKLAQAKIAAVQINTGGACHLDTPLIEAVLPEKHYRYIFIENIGNLVCPAEFMIGEHIKLLISTVTEGSDKPYKYPLAFEKADIILLNKADLLDYVDFDMDYFMAGARKLNPQAPIFVVSGKTGLGFKEAADWIKRKSAGEF